MHSHDGQVVIHVFKIGLGCCQLAAQSVELAFRIPRIYARLRVHRGDLGLRIEQGELHRGHCIGSVAISRSLPTKFATVPRGEFCNKNS